MGEREDLINTVEECRRVDQAVPMDVHFALICYGINSDNITTDQGDEEL